MLKCFNFYSKLVMSTALLIKGLKKTYANQLEALKGIDLCVNHGDFYALLGSNGAGKTTVIGIICGLLNKTSGSIKVLGFNQSSHVNQVKKLIGLMPQEFNFNPFEPIEEILINQAGYYGIAKSKAKIQAELLLKEVDLWEKRFDMAKSLSGGMKRRLMLARALIHQPKILILDEPTAGVDVKIRHSIWRFLSKLNRQGMTIILTTHYLGEAELLCRNVAILNEGKVIKQSSMKALLSQVDQQVLILESLSQLPQTITSDRFKCERLDDHSLQVVLNSDISITSVLHNLDTQGVIVDYVHSAQNRLETLFLYLTNKEK